MKFSEALKLLEQGRPVRIKTWSHGTHIKIVDNHIVNQTGDVITIPGLWWLREEWEEFEDMVDITMCPHGTNFRFENNDYVVLPAYMLPHARGFGKMIPVWNITKRELVHFSGDECKVKRL